MSQILISSNPNLLRTVDTEGPVLEVSELFYDTIQGENLIGYPAAFLRLQGCSLSCKWCDTKEVWRYGNPYSIDELLEFMQLEDIYGNSMLSKLSKGQHLVFTGGSPLRQQSALLMLVRSFITRYGFKPFIEIENECTIDPLPDLIGLTDCWNNSPKLSSSGNAKNARYKTEIVRKLASLSNSWFKFVITDVNDWQEIQDDFLDNGIIRYDQVVLMPCGASRAELETRREMVVGLAIEQNVRYSTREHIVLWDQKVGV